MKRIIVLILSLLFLNQSGYALEPIKVAFIYTAGGTISVQVKLTANGSDLFTGEPLTNISANGSGVVIINVQDYAGSANQWANFASGDVTTNHTLDIYVNGTLFSQQRLDQLIKMQSSTSVFDNDGNLNPPTSNSSLGSDDNRWEDAYVGSNTLHVGPDGGMIGGTEMTLSYNAGEGQIAVDGTNVLTATAAGVTIPGSLTMTTLPGTGNRNIGVDTDGNVVINTNPNITAGDGLTIDGNNDLDVGGSATIIANVDNIEVNSSATANQVLLSSGIVGSPATYGAIPLDNSNSVSGTLPVANGGTGASTLASGNFLQGNGTGAVTATKAVPTGTVVGTTDTQTLTNKTIDSDNNTITNIVNADIKTAAAIDATKLADGSVTNAELQFISTVTSNVQTQLDGKASNTHEHSTADLTSGTLAVTRGGTGASTLDSGNFLQGNGTGAVTATKAVPTGTVVGTTDSQTLTNKTIDSDNNTITNIMNADIKSSAAIDATKLADGSVTNAELQFISTVTSNVQDQLDSKQLNLPDSTGKSGQFLKTENGNLKWETVSGSGSGGAFTSASGVTKGNSSTDDFLFGSNTLDYIGSGSETKIYFDKSKGALRAGQIDNTNWDIDSIGSNSFASGFRTKAKGLNSIAMGSETFASGDHSTAMGNNTIAKSYSETVVGSFNTDYTPNDSSDFDINDRAFIVGNGSSSGPRSDALVIYKSGDADINGNLKVQDDITLSNLAGAGTRNIGVDSTGKIIELAGGGGGSSLPEITKLEYTGSDILINNLNYFDIPNITLALEANSTYLIKGVLGVNRVGSANSIQLKFDYDGTFDLCMMTISVTTFGITNESNNYSLPASTVKGHSLDGIIKTTAAGTFQMQVRKTNISDVNINNENKFVLIKVQ